MQLLLDHSEAADVNNADRTGFTPLHAAAFRGHHDVCEVLLAAGADATAICHATRFAGANEDCSTASSMNIRGQNCAVLAEQAGHDEIAAMLRGHSHKNERKLS